MYHRLARVILALSLLLTLILAGCQEKKESGSAKFIPTTTSQAVGPAGGVILLTLPDSTSFQLTIPAGALSRSENITLSSREPTAGQHFNLLLEPALLTWKDGRKATLVITPPAWKTLPTDGALVYDGTFIPFTRLPDDRLSVELSAFAGAPATASKPSLLAAAAEALAPTDACGSAPQLQTDGGLAAVDAVEIELYGQCMVSAVQALAASGAFEDAVRTASSVAAYLEKSGQGDISQYLTEAQNAACSAYSTALAAASAATIDSMGALYDAVKPVLFWETTVQQLGVACSGIAPDDYQTVINAKTGEAIAFYDSVQPSITNTTSQAYLDARDEAAQSAVTVRQVLSLNPSAAVQGTLNAEIGDRAQPGILDALLQAPWQKCREDGDYSELVHLMEILDGPDAVKNAAQYCGTTLNATIKDLDGNTLSTLDGTLGGVDAATVRATGLIQSDKSGILVLTGPIRGLGCAAGAGGTAENLSVRLDGYEIGTIISPPFLSNEFAINIPQTLLAAYPDPGAVDALTSAELTIVRNGSGCGDFWGANPEPLLTLQLEFQSMDIKVITIDTLSDEGTEVAASASSGFTLTPLGGDSSLPVSLSATQGSAFIQMEMAKASPSSFYLSIWTATDVTAAIGSGTRGQFIFDFTAPVNGTLSWAAVNGWFTASASDSTAQISVIQIMPPNSSYQTLYIVDMRTGEPLYPTYTQTSLPITAKQAYRLYVSYSGGSSALGVTPTGSGNAMVFTFTGN